MRILVVDDEAALAENVSEILGTAGHQTEIASSAEEALTRIRVDPDGVDLLLTDYRLPGATGADLIRAVRSLGRPIPALVMTAYYDDAIADRVMSAGAADIFEKPVNLGRLLSSVVALGRGPLPG